MLLATLRVMPKPQFLTKVVLEDPGIKRLFDLARSLPEGSKRDEVVDAIVSTLEPPPSPQGHSQPLLDLEDEVQHYLSRRRVS